MRFPLLLLLLLLPQSESVRIDCAPRNVLFSTSNKKNKLSWSPPNKSEDIRYTVEYCECHGGKYWKEKLECTNITETLCDLTKETSNSAETYYGRVTAISQVCSKLSKPTQLISTLRHTKCVPRNVTFTSENMKNKLTWSPPKISKGVRYTVEYFIYGEECWQEKLECTNITETLCDLTNETSNSSKQYIGRVTATSQVCSQSIRASRFYPDEETTLGPPTVNLIQTDTSIEINLTHPIDLHHIYKYVTYHIYKNDISIAVIKVPYYKIEYLAFHTTYCITAKVSVFGKESSLSKKACITTKPDRRSDEIVTVIVGILSVVLVACVLFAAGYGVHKYIHVSNLSQPHILNITANNNKNNRVFVEGHTVTIHLITIESGIKHLQKNMSDEQKIQTKSELYFTDGGDHISHDSGVIEDDLGYVSLPEPVPASTPSKPQLSPYDMPHRLVREQVIPISAPLDPELGEQDLYGQIKCKSDTASWQENDDLKVIQNISDRTLSAYLPKNDNHVTKLHSLNDDQEFLIDQNCENVTDDTDLSESGTLFVDWSPKSPHLRIPNLCIKADEQFCTEECHEVKEGLLSHLSILLQPEEPSEKDELVQLMERWELSIKMEE